MLFPFSSVEEALEEENAEYIYFDFAFASVVNVILRGTILCFLHVTPIAEMEVVQKNHIFKVWTLSLQLKLVFMLWDLLGSRAYAKGQKALLQFRLLSLWELLMD